MMKKIFFGLVFLFAALFFSSCRRRGPLEAVRPVAERLIADTSFDLVAREPRPAPFPVLFPGDSNGLFVCELQLPADSVYRLAVSAASPAQLSLDGRAVLSLAGDGTAYPKEIAYDTYLFDRYALLRLAAGVHRVVIETTGRAAFGIVDSLDFPAKGVIYSVLEHEKGRAKGAAADSAEYVLAVKPGAAFVRHSYAEWHYANGAAMLGLSALADATGEERYAAHLRRFCESTLAAAPLFARQYFERGLLRTQNYRMFRRGMLDDTTAPALPFLEYARRCGMTDSLRRLLASMADYALNEQPRLADGTFVRPEPRWTVWCDDLFMSAVFLVRYAALTGDGRCVEEAVRQAVAYDRCLRDPATGLLFHGWDAVHGRPVGQRWGRANGWFAWALSELLLGLEPGHPSYDALLAIHRRHLAALLRYQAPDGMWHQLLDRPDTYRESSATAAFVLALARAVRRGWGDAAWRDDVLRGWRALERRIAPDGTLSGICRSMSIAGDVAAYAERPTLPNDPRGLGMLFAAAVEVDAMLRSTGGR